MLKSKIQVAFLAMVAMLAVVEPSFATVPGEATTIATDLTTEIGDYVTLVLPVLGAMVAAMLGFKLLKKFLSKAL